MGGKKETALDKLTIPNSDPGNNLTPDRFLSTQAESLTFNIFPNLSWVKLDGLLFASVEFERVSAGPLSERMIQD